jgi:predicted ATPase/DNA-binding SARP family transcriptional activator
MTDSLSLRLLGTPQAARDGVPLTGYISAKAQALLYYLAVTGRPHSRESLAGLLWSDMPEAQAGKNLRNVLSNLRGLAGGNLLITRQDVAFDRASPHSLDVSLFLTALAEAAGRDLGALHHAVELYQGDFLEGFYPGEAQAFEEWVLGQRGLLKGHVLQALHTLVVRHLEREEYAAGIDYANRLLALEPWREETHRHLMVLLARSRQRSAALAQYETCRRVLARELSVEPMPETTALYEQLKSAAAPPPHNLPPQPTAFVGRAAELAEIARYLNDPGDQLLTLVGSGGIGKTRLALQAAARCVEPESSYEARFANGVFLIPLAGVAASAQGEAEPSLMAAMADALHFDFQGPVHPQAQLLSYLRDKRMLLVLDNFEHLVAEARQLGDILRLAPGIKLLVTSRARLNLREECLLEVVGLDYPAEAVPPGADPAADFSAIALFVQQARRVRPGFSISSEDWPAVVRICQLAEGVPLAIELAASWLRVLSCGEILAELEKGLDFLTSSLQNIAERHRSLRAVFDHSWALLPADEQALFRRLSVFRGGFQREAAAQVVEASLPLLAGLADKSLVRRSAAGRYEVHELLRQYAEEQLRAAAAEFTQVHDQHCRYYAALLAQYGPQLQGNNTEIEAALAALSLERENVRAAWNWAVEQRKSVELNQFMDWL